MIFKTFNSDIDKWTAKIGIFGKSFNELRTAVNNAFKTTIDNIDNFDENVGFWSSLKDNLFPKKEDIESQLIDVMPEINTDNVSDATEKIKVMASAVSENKTTWQQLFDTLPENEKHFAQLGQQMEGQIITEEGVIKANQKAREAAISHNAALKQQTLGAKAATVATKALAIAGNMIAMWAITKGLELAVKGIDELAHSTEHCKERVDELMSNYQSALDKANSNAKTVEDLASRYEELSKGVNNLGENISLTADEYSEYNDIVNQIADMFPSLIQGHTNEGNAILSLKGNVEQLRDAYKEAQQEAYNMLIISGKDSDGNDIIKNWKNLHGTDFFSQLFDLGASDVGGKISTQDAIEQLTALSNMSAEAYRNIERITGSGTREQIASLTDIEKDIGYGSFIYKALGIDENVTDEAFNEARNQAQALIQTYQAEIDSGLKNVKTLTNAYLMTNEDYDKLDEQSKTAASLLVNSIDESIANGFKNKSDVGAYVTELITLISNNAEAQKALTKLFTMDTTDMSVGEIQSEVDSYMSIIADAIHEDSDKLKIRLGFDYADDLSNNYEASIQSGTEKFSGVLKSDLGKNSESDLYYEDVEAELRKFAEENSINTQEEVAFWNKCIEESETRQEAQEKYLKGSEEIKSGYTPSDIFSLKNADGSSTLLGEISESIDNIQNAYKTLSSAVEEYNASGFLSIDTIQSITELGSGYLDYLIDEEGNIRLDQAALQDLTVARLQDMQAQMQQELLSQVESIQSEKEANQFASQAYREKAESIDMVTAAMLKNKVAELNISDINKEKVLNAANHTLNQINTMFDNAIAGVYANPNSIGGTIEQAETDYKTLLEAELNLLDKQIEAGLISFQDYISKRKGLIEDYYNQGKISADEYYSYLEKHYDTQLSYMDKVINAVTRRIDKEIDGLEKQKDDIESYYKVQIDALEKQKTLLQEANQERQRQIDLQKAMYELERARNQRTKLIYSEDKGMHYVADDSAIRDAQQEADDAEFEIKISEIENSISKLEEARDAETEAIDAMIDKLEEYKDQWNDITSAYEEEQENLLAAQILGRDWENDILNTRLDTLNKFKDDYIAIQQSMVDATYQAAQAMANNENAKITDTSKGKLSGDTGWEVIDESTATSVGGKKFDNETAANNYAEKLNNEKAASYNMSTEEFVNSNIPGYYVRKKYHTGLQQGLVDKNSFDDDFKLVQKVGLGQNEVPAILKEGEAVVTQEQISNLADGIRSASLPDYLTPLPDDHPAIQMRKKFEALLKKNNGDLDYLTGNVMTQHSKQMEKWINHLNTTNVVNNTKNVQPITIQIGDINLTGVQDVNGLAQAIKTRFPNAMLQEIHRR